MKMFVKPKRTYLYRDTVDFRKSIDGLVAIVEGEFERDAYTAALFLFCNKTKDKLKLVYWAKTGGLLCGTSKLENKSSNGHGNLPSFNGGYL